ncbi:MAG: ATP-binding protein [Pseudomonadota bacterium]
MSLLINRPVRLILGLLLLYAWGAAAIFGYLNYRLSATLVDQIDRQLLEQQRLLVRQYHDYGFPGVQRTIQGEIAAKGRGERVYRILDGKGRIVLEAGELPLPRLARTDGIREIEVTAGTQRERVRVLAFSPAADMTVFVALGMQSASRIIDAARAAFVGTAEAIVLLGLILGLWLAKRFWGQIQAFNRHSQRIVKSGDLSSRMPVSGDDEFSILAVNTNAMLERIEKLVQGIRQVSDNIAHDLRTPLTRLRAEVEVALQRNDPEAHRLALERTLSELQNMQAIFNSLLAIGRAEAGSMPVRRNSVDLSELLNELVELYAPSAEEHDLDLSSDIAEGLQIEGDRQLLAQAMSNLLDNALKYVPAGGRIELHAAHQGGRVEVRLEDSGPGIPPEMREKVFERFTRLDPSRTMAGSGLGLSLVKAFVELHRGSIGISQSSLGGTAFTILLPLS